MVSKDAKRRPQAIEVLKHTFFIQSEGNTVEYVPLFFSTPGTMNCSYNGYFSLTELL